MTGQIKTLVPNRGFGFILGESGVEFFFHRTACVDHEFASFKPGDRVTFIEVISPKGPRAEGVSRIGA